MKLNFHDVLQEAAKIYGISGKSVVGAGVSSVWNGAWRLDWKGRINITNLKENVEIVFFKDGTVKLNDVLVTEIDVPSLMTPYSNDNTTKSVRIDGRWRSKQAFIDAGNEQLLYGPNVKDDVTELRRLTNVNDDVMHADEKYLAELYNSYQRPGFIIAMYVDYKRYVPNCTTE